jgi:hypothetical protein
MQNKTHIVNLIAGFYAVTYDNRTLDLDYRTEFVGLLRHLHERAFPGYKFDPKELLAQAERQLRGNEQAVEHYTTVSFQFEPLSGGGDKLVINIGATGETLAHPNGTLGIWTDDLKIDAQIQSFLEAVS